jgi:hypothetical protein
MTRQPRRPADVSSTAPLTTIATGLAGHEWVLVNARHGIGDPVPAEEVTQAASSALALQHALADRALDTGWVNARDALSHGATIDQVAAAMDLTPDEVAFGLGRWADGQRRHGLMAEYEHVTVLALVEDGGDR